MGCYRWGGRMILDGKWGCRVCVDGTHLWYLWVKIVKNQGNFYGMELPRVGAFTDFRGSGYRNPVQNLGQKSKFRVKSGFPGLV